MSQPDDPQQTDLLPITEVERQTGIRQATLRVWEKRYGFPQPLRDRHGDRVYPTSQVQRLLAVRRLIDQGVRPGQIFSGEAAPDICDTPPCPAQAAAPLQYEPVFALLRAYRLPELHVLFQHRLLELGLRRFVIDFLAPLAAEVGTAWSRGELPVRCEHLFTHLAKSVLHAGQAAVRVSGNRHPKVLLATLTGETHALGIMMAEAVMVSFELGCIQLGTALPPLEIAAAAEESGVDVVALSFSSYFPRKSLVHMVTGLRTALPSATALWIGGDGTRRAGALGAGIEAFDSLACIEGAVARLRSHA